MHKYNATKAATKRLQRKNAVPITQVHSNVNFQQHNFTSTSNNPPSSQHNSLPLTKVSAPTAEVAAANQLLDANGCEFAEDEVNKSDQLRSLDEEDDGQLDDDQQSDSGHEAVVELYEDEPMEDVGYEIDQHLSETNSVGGVNSSTGLTSAGDSLSMNSRGEASHFGSSLAGKIDCQRKLNRNCVSSFCRMDQHFG